MRLILAVALLLIQPLALVAIPSDQAVYFPNGTSLTGVCSSKPVDAVQFEVTCKPAAYGVYLVNQTAFQEFQKNSTLFGVSDVYYTSYSCIGTCVIIICAMLY